MPEGEGNPNTAQHRCSVCGVVLEGLERGLCSLHASSTEHAKDTAWGWLEDEGD